MPAEILPEGGSSFRMGGRSGFGVKFSKLTRTSQFSSLRNNRSDAEKIFKSLVPTIKRNGKIPLSTRQRAHRKFAAIPGTTKQDERSSRRVLDVYK